jgi:basic amino acid/polyamine antiporter, APA family
MSSVEPRSTSSSAKPGLRRSLGLWSATAVLIGSTIGSGIFRTPAGVAARLPGPLPLLLVWVTGGLFAICGALTLAEIAGAMPDTGGPYVFIREAWGRMPAFVFGWSELIIIRAASLGAISTTFAEYLFRLIDQITGHPSASHPVHIVAALAIATTAAFNYIGLGLSSAVQNVTTLAKYGGLVLIVLVACAVGFSTGGVHNFTPAVPPGSLTPAAFGLALVSVLWAFDGWADLSFVSGEVANPRRVLPRAIIGGTLAVMVIYLLANVSYMAVLPVSAIEKSPLVAADVANKVVGGWGTIFVSATVVISTFGTLNATLITAPRIFYAMAADGQLLHRVASVHPKFGTPYVAVMLAAFMGILFVLLRTFDQLADTFVTAIVPFYALSVAAIFVLRRRADYDPPFRVPGYPVVPALFVLATLFLLTNAVVDPTSRWPTLAVFGAVLLGVPVYALTVRKYVRLRTSTDAP